MIFAYMGGIMRPFYYFFFFFVASQFFFCTNEIQAQPDIPAEVTVHVLPCFYSAVFDQNIFIKAVAQVALTAKAEGHALIQWLGTNNSWHRLAHITTKYDTAETAVQKLCNSDASTAHCLRPFKKMLVSTIKRLQTEQHSTNFDETALCGLIAQSRAQGAHVALYATPALIGHEHLPMISLAHADLFFSAHHYFSADFCKQVAMQIRKELPSCTKIVLFIAERHALTATERVREVCDALGIELRYLKI